MEQQHIVPCWHRDRPVDDVIDDELEHIRMNRCCSCFDCHHLFLYLLPFWLKHLATTSFDCLQSGSITRWWRWDRNTLVRLEWGSRVRLDPRHISMGLCMYSDSTTLCVGNNCFTVYVYHTINTSHSVSQKLCLHIYFLVLTKTYWN